MTRALWCVLCGALCLSLVAFQGQAQEKKDKKDEKKVEKKPMRRVAVPTTPPADLAAALRKNKKAHTTFGAFAPSHKREYIEWITEAKSAGTRERRLQTAVDWMADGKARNWKYLKA